MPPGQKLPAGSVDLQSHNNEALSEYPPRIRYVNPTEGCSADVPAECPLQSGGDISPDKTPFFFCMFRNYCYPNLFTLPEKEPEWFYLA